MMLSLCSSSIVQLWLSTSSSSSSEDDLPSLHYPKISIEFMSFPFKHKPQSIFAQLLYVMQLIHRRRLLTVIVDDLVDMLDRLVLE